MNIKSIKATTIRIQLLQSQENKEIAVNRQFKMRTDLITPIIPKTLLKLTFRNNYHSYNNII